MQIVCDEEAVEDAKKNGVDLVRFIDLLAQESSSWDLCEIASSWGLILFAFFSSHEKALVPINMDVFRLTQGTVISDAGQIVPRWQRLAQETLSWAEKHRKPRGVILVD